MHEVSLVAELVEACLREAGGAKVRRVTIRHASTASEEVIRQAFEMLTADGPLAKAELATERFAIGIACGCGFDGPVGPEDQGGGFLVCPVCGAVHPAPRKPEIELLAVETAIVM